MYRLAFVALFALAFAQHYCYECNSGDSFWCSNVRNAKRCNMMEHCIATFWKNNTIPLKDEPACDKCALAVTEARLIMDNVTEEQISEKLITQACSLIPKVLGCGGLVRYYLKEVLQILSSNMDPKPVCTVLKMCTPEESDSEPADYCEDCISDMIELYARILEGTLSREALSGAMQELCGAYVTEDPCKNLTAQYLPILSAVNPSNIADFHRSFIWCCLTDTTCRRHPASRLTQSHYTDTGPTSGCSNSYF